MNEPILLPELVTTIEPGERCFVQVEAPGERHPNGLYMDVIRLNDRLFNLARDRSDPDDWWEMTVHVRMIVEQIQDIINSNTDFYDRKRKNYMPMGFGSASIKGVDSDD